MQDVIASDAYFVVYTVLTTVAYRDGGMIGMNIMFRIIAEFSHHNSTMAA